MKVPEKLNLEDQRKTDFIFPHVLQDLDAGYVYWAIDMLEYKLNEIIDYLEVKEKK